MRTCISCRATRPKSELLRVTWQGASLAIDRRQRLPGRGAYLCADRQCWRQRLDAKALGRTLKKTIPADARDALLRGLTKGDN